ncbi:unnamed protein product [Phytophthora fragariaefolia]|uniref:Unnamed protein product n=1 Tax=Phytophthora fragariaefolia TaxID=1490495 RepID=A0A9W7CRF7_9STRA|nr:unnamed protein product [Phytophthora fragariaefolia]
MKAEGPEHSYKLQLAAWYKIQSQLELDLHRPEPRSRLNFVNGSFVVAPPSYVIGITEGSAAASKALVLNGSSSITGIASLSATSLTGTLQTAAQPNITSIGTLSDGLHHWFTYCGSKYHDHKSVFTVDSIWDCPLRGFNRIDIHDYRSFSRIWRHQPDRYRITNGDAKFGPQPIITSVGTLSSLSVSGSISGTLSTAAQPNITSQGNPTNLNIRSGATIGKIANISMPAQAAGYSSWITIGKSSSGNEGRRIGYYHDSTCANQYIYLTHSNKSPFFVSANNSCVGINTLTPTYDLDLVGQACIPGTLLFAGASRTISNVQAYSAGTITTSGDITCGGSLKGYQSYGNQSTISTLGVLTEVAIGSPGAYNSQEYLLINGNGNNYLDGSYTRMCSVYGSNVTPTWFQIEVSNGSKTVFTSARWIGNNSDTDLRFGTNNATYSIYLGGTNRGRWGFGTASPAYGFHNALTVSTTLDAGGSGVAYLLKSGGLVSTLGPLSGIPVGIGTVGALLAGSSRYTTSDARIKNDWTELSDDVCDAVLTVEPLLFRYKSDDDTIPLQFGYKAQDLLRANIPHCINFVPNKDMHVEGPEVDTEGIQYSVDYSKMVCLLHNLSSNNRGKSMISYYLSLGDKNDTLA